MTSDWARELKHVLLPDGFTLRAITSLFRTEDARTAFLEYMFHKTALHDIGDTSAMDPSFSNIPYALTPAPRFLRDS